MSATSITDRQKVLMVFLRRFLEENSRMPSLREMADHLGAVSKTTPHRLLKCLEERGHIKRQPYRRQAIELIDGPWDIPDSIRREMDGFCKRSGRTPGSVIGDALLIYLRHPSRRG
jgi:SOS-response transcriptional repressor LexA